MSNDKKICLGVFAGAHGVKGAAKIKTFTEDAKNITAYGPVATKGGARCFTLNFVRELKEGVALVTAPEIESREDAMALSGVELYVARARLPQTSDEDEFYLEDLIGLTAISETGEPLGVVAAVPNYGAGDLLELRNIPGVAGARLIPFTKQAAPSLDLAAGLVVISETYLPSRGEESPPEHPKGGKK